MNAIVTEAIAEFNRANGRLINDFAKTPDEKINWSPSSTCRTPVQLVAHCGMAILGMKDMFEGKPFQYASLAEMDTHLRELEKAFTTRAQVLDLLEENSKIYIAWLSSLSDETLGSILQMPFGPIPMSKAITMLAGHSTGHASQIEYIQTIYGDHDWYM